MRVQRPTPIFKVTEFQNLKHYGEKSFKPISVFESKRVDKIKSGNFMFLFNVHFVSLTFFFYLIGPFYSYGAIKFLTAG